MSVEKAGALYHHQRPELLVDKSEIQKGGPSLAVCHVLSREQCSLCFLLSRRKLDKRNLCSSETASQSSLSPPRLRKLCLMSPQHLHILCCTSSHRHLPVRLRHFPTCAHVRAMESAQRAYALINPKASGQRSLKWV